MQAEIGCSHIPGRSGRIQGGQNIPDLVGMPGLNPLLAAGLEKPLQPFVFEALDHVTWHNISRDRLQATAVPCAFVEVDGYGFGW